MFLEISQNSQKNTCVRASFYYKRDFGTGVFSKNNTFSFRTPPVAASDVSIVPLLLICWIDISLLGVCQEKKSGQLLKACLGKLNLNGLINNHALFTICFRCFARPNKWAFISKSFRPYRIHPRRIRFQFRSVYLWSKHTDDYNYMINFIKDNRLLLEICTLKTFRSLHVCHIFLITIKLQEEINPN